MPGERRRFVASARLLGALTYLTHARQTADLFTKKRPRRRPEMRAGVVNIARFVRQLGPMGRFETGFLSEYTDNAMLEELRRAAANFKGDNLTQTEFLKLSAKVSPQTLQRRFGTWGNALEQAGLAHLYVAPKRFTDEECFENLANVWTHLGRPPAFLEMKNPPSIISPKSYTRRWGTWRKSVYAFMEWANAEGEPHADRSTASVAPEARSQPRSAENDRTVRPGLRFKVFLRDRFRCVACGRSPATCLNIELHADHIIPWADGGKTTLENLQTLCEACNLGKGRSYGKAI